MKGERSYSDESSLVTTFAPVSKDDLSFNHSVHREAVEELYRRVRDEVDGLKWHIVQPLMRYGVPEGGTPDEGVGEVDLFVGDIVHKQGIYYEVKTGTNGSPRSQIQRARDYFSTVGWELRGRVVRDEMPDPVVPPKRFLFTDKNPERMKWIHEVYTSFDSSIEASKWDAVYRNVPFGDFGGEIDVLLYEKQDNCLYGVMIAPDASSHYRPLDELNEARSFFAGRDGFPSFDGEVIVRDSIRSQSPLHGLFSGSEHS